VDGGESAETLELKKRLKAVAGTIRTRILY